MARQREQQVKTWLIFWRGSSQGETAMCLQPLLGCDRQHTESGFPLCNYSRKLRCLISS